MEYSETRIQSDDEVIAKIRPKASILNPKVTPSNIVWKKMHSITSPLKILGAMDRTSANIATLATIVHPSLMFGCLFDSKIKGAAIAGHKIANNGVINSIYSVTPPLTPKSDKIS